MSGTVLARDAISEVRVRAIASNGSGVADLPDGRVVFVPRTAPGDHARVRLGKVKRAWAEASLVELLEAAPGRVVAPCPRFLECGGCTLQHLPYGEQLEWKSRFVSDAMARIGGVEVDPPSVFPSPRPFAYRNRIAYTLRRLRGGRVVAGFHALGRPAHVIDIEQECLLPEGQLRTAWIALRSGWGSGARRLPAGGRLRLTLRSEGAHVTLVVDGGERLWDARELAEAVPALATIWHRSNGGERHRMVHRPAIGPEVGSESDTDGEPSLGGAFLQVNSEVGDALRDAVLESAGAPRKVVDAYCGVGVYARHLARSGAEVTGIEVDPDACALARHGAPGELSIVEGSVEEHLVTSLPAELLIVNPPRAGLHESVSALVAASGPERVIYVSCDPATLARDAARLSASYELIELRSFDLFPQTAHVETVAVLSRRRNSELGRENVR